MVPGRTLLWEAVPGLSGHDSQFSGKLRQDLTDFPSEIHHVLWSPFIKMTGHNIDMLRVSFGDINFNIPPIYAPDDSQFAAGQTCFEELLVPRNEHFVYRSTEEATSFSAALSAMCALSAAVDTRGSSNDGSSQPRILFLERPFDRQIINAPSMCSWVKHKFAAEAHLISDSMAERHGACAPVESIRRHDTFVTIDGSQALLLSFARPGSVVVLVSPKNSFSGLIKLLLSSARIHVLEFLVHRPTELALDVESSEYHQRMQGGTDRGKISADRLLGPLHCARQRSLERTCFEFWIRNHVLLNTEEFLAFVKHAQNVLNRVSAGEDGFEPDLQFSEWGIRLAHAGEDASLSLLSPCQRRPAEVPETEAAEFHEYESQYPFVSVYGQHARRVAWEVRKPTPCGSRVPA
jgi:hypothetical protein